MMIIEIISCILYVFLLLFFQFSIIFKLTGTTGETIQCGLGDTSTSLINFIAPFLPLKL